MINTYTKNKSFIQMWRYLQDMDVENADFMLRLDDESLIDFSPSDFSNLESKDEINELHEKVQRECRNNIWFFFREVVNVNMFGLSYNSPVPQLHIPYQLNYNALWAIYLYSNGVNFAIPTHDIHCDIDGTENIYIDIGMYLTYILLNVYNDYINSKAKSKIDLVNMCNFSSKVHNSLNMFVSILTAGNPRYTSSLSDNVRTTIGIDSLDYNKLSTSDNLVIFINDSKSLDNLVLFKIVSESSKLRPNIMIGYGVGEDFALCNLHNNILDNMVIGRFIENIKINDGFIVDRKFDTNRLYVLK
jgi:hypothetical protein|nr:MAG TPA: large terminase [Caudoviricetes sp.]